MNPVDKDTALEAAAPSDPQRRTIQPVLMATAVIGIAAILAAASVLVGRGRDTTIVQPGRPREAAPTSTVVTEPGAREAPFDRSGLRISGIGPIVIGMTLDEASAATGQAIRIGPGTDRGRGCAHATPDGGPQGLQFMVVDGRIVRVEVGGGPVRTLSGIGTGSSEAEVLAAYPDDLRMEPNPYTGHRGGKYLIYTPGGDAGLLSLLFEVERGTVRMFRSGLVAAVMAPEGCS